MKDVVVASVLVTVTVEVVVCTVVFTVISGVDVTGSTSGTVGAIVSIGTVALVVVTCCPFFILGVSVVCTTVVVNVIIVVVVITVVVVLVVAAVVFTMHRNPPGRLTQMAPRVIQSSMPWLHSSTSLQCFPSPLYPVLQEQSKLPILFLQFAFAEQLWIPVSHSSMSLHMCPSPVNPALVPLKTEPHLQLNDPFVLWHCACMEQV